jgi:hypothetical protein
MYAIDRILLWIVIFTYFCSILQAKLQRTSQASSPSSWISSVTLSSSSPVPTPLSSIPSSIYLDKFIFNCNSFLVYYINRNFNNIDILVDHVLEFFHNGKSNKFNNLGSLYYYTYKTTNLILIYLDPFNDMDTNYFDGFDRNKDRDN